jgi:hypothetical protein
MKIIESNFYVKSSLRCNYNVLITVAGSFVFLLLFRSTTMCIRIFLGHLVIAEPGCNMYLRDINIFPLSKKY